MNAQGWQITSSAAPPVAPPATPPPSTSGWQITSTPTPSAPAMPAQTAQSAGLVTSGEGQYQMKNPQGQVVPVSYSHVHQALDKGHLFADQNTLRQYARDHAADPLDESRVDQWLDKHPYLGAPLNVVAGLGTGAMKTMTGLDKAPKDRANTEAQLAAATPTKGFGQGLGEAGENVGEFFSGEELLGLLGKAGAGLGVADKLKAVTGLAQTLEKYPMVAKILKIGTSAAKQGTVAGGQTYAKTGDAGAALTAAGETAALSGVLAIPGAVAGKAGRALTPEAGKMVEGVELPPGAARAAVTPAEQRGVEAYGKMAQETVRPHLEELNAASGEPKMTWEAGPGGVQGEPAGMTTPVPKIDVADSMSKIGDYAAGRAVLKEQMNAAYDHFDKLTGGDFRKANADVQAADEAAASGNPQKIGDYVDAVNRMDALLDSTKGSATPEMIAAVKSGFRKYYTLGGVSRALDRALDGMPGESAVSQEQRGMNGKKLLTGLNNLVLQHGRDGVETMLGGPGRLKAMEAIGNATKTNEGRKALNFGVVNIAKFTMLRAAGVIGAKVGYETGGLVGAGLGYAAGEGGAIALQRATGKVYRALLANPKVAQNLLFAIQSGAKPEHYGPFIATMIQQHETEAARERMATEKPPEKAQP